MDLLPTLLAMTGASPPAGIDGQDIRPVMQGRAPAHEYLFWSFNNQRAVRQGDWKLIVNPPNFPGAEISEKLWLSNLEADPEERRNLAGAESARVAAMTEKLRQWEQEMKLPSR
jgi:arylsulfatase A-like enzyme